MKQKHLYFTLILTILFFRCANTPKITYNIPKGYPEAKKPELLARLDKGKDLFKTNCSPCHGVFSKGKDSIPNFTNTQIDNYSARFMRKDPKNHAVIAQMSPDQMNEVLQFLKYKRPQDTSVHAPKMKRLGRR